MSRRVKVLWQVRRLARRLDALVDELHRDEQALRLVADSLGALPDTVQTQDLVALLCRAEEHASSIEAAVGVARRRAARVLKQMEFK